MDFVVFGLDFVASGFDFVVAGFAFVTSGLAFVVGFDGGAEPVGFASFVALNVRRAYL